MNTPVQELIPAFFKVYIPANSSQRMKAPFPSASCMKGMLPNKAWLRDSHGNLWPVEVVKTGDDFFFEDGWVTFIAENGRKNREIEIEEEDEDGNAVIDSCDEGDDQASDYAGGYDEDEDYDDDVEFANERLCIVGFMKNDATWGRRPDFRKIQADVFGSGIIPRPKNPYFVKKCTPSMHCRVRIPIDLIRYFDLKLPLKMFILEEEGRKWKVNVVRLRNGSLHLSKGWAVKVKFDTCPFEFVEGRSQRELFLKVRIIRTGP